MFTKRHLVFISLLLALVFHFIFYWNYYGPSISILRGDLKYLFGISSATILIFLYFTTYWRVDLKGNYSTLLIDVLIFWIFISLVRSSLEIGGINDAISFVFSNYMALSLLPVFFIIVGVNPNYFSLVNRSLFAYTIISFFFSLLFINSFELQLYLVYPLFFIVLTIPLRSTWGKVLIIAISISVIIVSLTNRAGIIRILFSYCILAAYYIMQKVNVNKRFLFTIIFFVLMLPVVSLYLGINGQSVFQIILGEENSTYSQLNPYADTRTFLYYEVFQDLKGNDALLFGKGLNAGYDSPSFRTYRREVVEVGFLQILMKMGIIGFVLYISVITLAIFKAIGRSRSLFLKSLGFLLTGYIIMLFVENQVAYNIFNVIIWISVGICLSPHYRELSDYEIKLMFNKRIF